MLNKIEYLAPVMIRILLLKRQLHHLNACEVLEIRVCFYTKFVLWKRNHATTNFHFHGRWSVSPRIYLIRALFQYISIYLARSLLHHRQAGFNSLNDGYF